MEQHHSSFEATLEIKGIDSIGVLNTITRTISDDFNVNIIRLLIEAKDGVFEGKVKMKVTRCGGYPADVRSPFQDKEYPVCGSCSGLSRKSHILLP